MRCKAIEDAFGIVRHGGNVVLFGIPAQPATIDIAESLIFKNLTVSAVNGREIWETWYTTRWLLEHGVVDLRPLITAELPLERFEEAFELLETGEACKIVLRPNGAGADEHRADETDRGGARRHCVTARTYKRFNVLESPQGPVVQMAGRGEVIVLSSNNYLGLAAHPEVVRAGIEGLERYGAGTASVRFICGTFEPHLELERALAELSGTEAALTYVSCWNANEAVDPDAHRRHDGDLHGRAEPREHHRRDSPLASRAEGDLPALGHERCFATVSRRRHARRAS